MTAPSGDEPDERARLEAADWFARMHGPDAARWTAELAAWRAADSDNESAYARLLQRWDQTAFLTDSATGRNRDLGRAAVWPRRPAIRYAAIAAVALLAAGLGAVTLDRAGISPHRAAPLDYASPDREVREIALADGPRVTLDAGAAITVDRARGARGLRLVRGRARIDLGTGSSEPFVVEADGGLIRASTGLFDVSLTGGLVKVVAWRGPLDVSTTGAPSPSRARRLTAGQQLVFSPARAMPAPMRAAPGDLGWTRGMLAFDQARLADAVAAFNRYNRVRIVLGAPALGDLRIAGAFRATDPEGFAKAVAGMFHLSLVTAPDGAILLTPGKKA